MHYTLPVVNFSDAEKRRIDRFLAEQADGLRAILEAAGCRLAAGLSPEDVCMAFANYRLRRIPVVPRHVHRSDTLTQRSNDLSSEERAAIDAIEDEMRAGADLYPRQSTSLLDPLNRDGLLADWDIQHLHLGLAGRPAVAPFVNRSERVLLVRFTGTDAYLIDCASHGRDVQPPWWDTDLPEALHRNWPESIAYLRLAVDGGPHFTWAQLRQMRPLRGFTFTTAVTVSDGTVYSLGWGVLSSGYSLEVGDYADRIMRRMVDKALAHTDDERVVIRGDHRKIHVFFEAR